MISLRRWDGKFGVLLKKIKKNTAPLRPEMRCEVKVVETNFFSNNTTIYMVLYNNGIL